MTTGAGGIGPDPQGVAHERIVRALAELPDIEVWDDPFEKVADVALTVLLAMPVADRMEAMGMVRYRNNWLKHLAESAGGQEPIVWSEPRPAPTTKFERERNGDQ